MKNQIKTLAAAAIFLASGFIASANETEREISLTTENQKAVVLRMDNVKAGTQISLLDENGKVLFQDEASAEAYGKVFNLSKLDKGQLQLEIESDETLEVMSIQVTEESARIESGSKKLIEKPIIKHNDKGMKIYFGKDHAGMKVSVFDEQGSIAFRDNVESNGSMKRYDISKLSSGEYKVQFTADGRSFYHTITLN
ncbi:DUF3244 domain-containing protein [Roseivirga sp.]|uniref:DUF3244 domain-containing protein n=1 Tax=Roseivirga sp. TaxID=1964215 RepID=UPI003B8AAD95